MFVLFDFINTVTAEVSKNTFGAVFLQQSGEVRWQPVRYASRKVTSDVQIWTDRKRSLGNHMPQIRLLLSREFSRDKTLATYVITCRQRVSGLTIEDTKFPNEAYKILIEHFYRPRRKMY